MRAFLLGALGVYAPQVLFFNALRFTSASSATVLQLVISPMSALAAVLFKREKATWGKAIGIGSALLGAVLIVGLDGFSIE